jgi:tetratricopeptide (TPR) repeat protein
MKRILYLAILVATIVFGGVLGYSIWKAKPMTSSQYFERGKKYYEEKDYSKASIELMNAVQKDGKNRDARHLLALTYMNQGNLSGTVQQLSAILESYPDDTKTSLELGNVYLSGGQADIAFFRNAQEIAQKVLSREPQNVAALTLLGNALAGLKDYEASVEQLKKAISVDPQNTLAFVSLGSAHVLQKKFPEAEQAFLKARQSNPKDKNAMVAIVSYYRTIGDAAKAEAAIKEALAVYPSDRTIYMDAVGFYNQANRLDEVEKVLRNALTGSTDPGPAFVLADIYASRERPLDSRKLLQEIEPKFPDNMEVRIRLAASLLPDQLDKARAEIDRILKAEPKSPVGQVLLGELQFASGQYNEAEATLGKDPAINSPFPEPHFYLGNIARAKGRLDEAQDRYQNSLLKNGGYIPAKVGLAQVFMQKGKTADAREEIRQVLSVRPHLTAARLLKAALDTIEKKFPEAEQEVNAVLKEQPDNAAAHLQMGLINEGRGRVPDAEKSMERALQLDPNSQETLQDVTRFYVRHKQTDKAIQTVNRVPDEKKQAFHYELIGYANFNGSRFDEAEKAYRKALEKDPTRARSDVYLVAEYIQQGRTDDALKELDVLTQKDPANASLYTAKGQMYERRGDVEGAKKNYTQALTINSSDAHAGNNLAYILAEEGKDLQTALNWAQSARRSQPEDPSVADTLGWIYYKMGNHILARDQLKFAVSKQPNNGLLQYHMGMIYMGNKQMSEAQAALKKAVATPSDFKEKPLAEKALKEIASVR